VRSLGSRTEQTFPRPEIELRLIDRVKFLIIDRDSYDTLANLLNLPNAPGIILIEIELKTC
jgi:hypothetical protein